jgi:hypothetical protein
MPVWPLRPSSATQIVGLAEFVAAHPQVLRVMQRLLTATTEP